MDLNVAQATDKDGYTQEAETWLPSAVRLGSGMAFAEDSEEPRVYVDGAKLPKTAPLRDVELAVGPHEIRVQNEGLGIDHTETVTVASPSAGTWYVMVRAYNTFSGVSLVASFDLGSANSSPSASKGINSASSPR